LYSINPSSLSERENYKFLIGSIVPRPIAFITTLSSEGILNAAPFSFFNIVSSNPPLISVSVQRREGKQKDTARNIVAVQEFVVHIVDESILQQVNKTAATLPSTESEVALTDLTPIASSVIAVPGIKEAKIRLECTLEQVVDLNGCDLIIGKVVHYHIEKSIYENGRIDHVGLGAVSRLAGNDYAKIGDVFTIARPK